MNRNNSKHKENILYAEIRSKRNGVTEQLLLLDKLSDAAYRKGILKYRGAIEKAIRKNSKKIEEITESKTNENSDGFLTALVIQLGCDYLWLFQFDKAKSELGRDRKSPEYYKVQELATKLKITEYHSRHVNNIFQRLVMTNRNLAKKTVERNLRRLFPK